MTSTILWHSDTIQLYECAYTTSENTKSLCACARHKSLCAYARTLILGGSIRTVLELNSVRVPQNCPSHSNFCDLLRPAIFSAILYFGEAVV